jgi:ligand-binding sensor domain-containing protein
MNKAGKYCYIILCLLLLAGFRSFSQTSAVNFHKLGFPEGLHDGIVRCIAQDRLGYTWVGTVGAINRFDGRKVTRFANIPGDSTSPYSGQPRYMHSDKAGRFWIGTETGLLEYDFARGIFKRIRGLEKLFILSIESIDGDILFIGARTGLYRYDIKNNTVFAYTKSTSPGHVALKNNSINDICATKDKIYLGTNKGLVYLDLKKDEAKKIDVPAIGSATVFSVSADSHDNIWICAQGNTKLVSVSPDHTHYQVFDSVFINKKNEIVPRIFNAKVDSHDNVWLLTSGDGLFQFNPSSGTYRAYLHDINFLSGPSSDSYRCLFEDPSGIIWLGCEVEGVNYLDPEKNLFTSIFPFQRQNDWINSAVGRAVAEDRQGFIWMGNHDGLSRYDPKTGQYREWHYKREENPVIYSPVIRSLYSDEEGYTWIGTGSGVNRYDPATDKMEFINSKDLPRSFYNSINGDRSGNIWFCTNDSAALYWYSRMDHSFHNISQHAVLKKFKGFSTVSYVMEDSKQRLWISFSRKGLVMLDKKTGATRHYLSSDTTSNGIIGNLIIDIKEDKEGIIWASSFNGITGIDVENNKFISFSGANGLPGNMAAPLVVDKLNRIWVGVNGGLSLLSADRKHITVFSLSDGLPSLGFPEHAGITTAEGKIIMPSYYGYFLFDPADYKDRQTQFNFYVSGCRVFDRDFIRTNEAENDPVLELKAAQNSFSFEITALNYMNPAQTWFAYKLDGFEKDWHFTQDPKAVYTNVPGGHYTFLYKASNTNADWDNIKPKKLSIHLQSYFYRTAWFRILLLCLVLAILFALYRYRTGQQRQMFQLKDKAQALEKEKAMVMYENLKQQLNPHFLFNSLTSLNSLIDAEPKAASEFLDSLSKTYRYILKSRDNETVPLADEIRFAENYVKLQKTRFEKGFDVHINIPEEYHHRKIVPVTLQNLIENAIKHNIIDEESPLLVNIYVEDGLLVVENNLQRKNFVETSNRQGLANMQSLYQYLSNRPVEIMETNGYFKIKLPLL